MTTTDKAKSAAAILDSEAPSWVHCPATEPSTPLPQREWFASHEEYLDNLRGWQRGHAGTNEQWQCRLLRLAIVREESASFAVCRMQGRGYPLLRVCSLPATVPVTAIQQALAGVSRRDHAANANAQWEADIRAAVEGLRRGDRHHL